MLCEFGCTKNTLYGLNTVYIGIAGLLLILSIYARNTFIVTSDSISGAVIFVGIFLLLVSLLGFYGTAKHHQVALFFYMVILSTVFVLQFFITVACLGSVSHRSISDLVGSGWTDASNQTRWDAENSFQCCGLKNTTDYAVTCEKLSCWPACRPCLDLIVERMSESLQTLGGIGLFFSFSELIGVWLTVRYRNMKNPDVDPVLYFEQQH